MPQSPYPQNGWLGPVSCPHGQNKHLDIQEDGLVLSHDTEEPAVRSDHLRCLGGTRRESRASLGRRDFPQPGAFSNLPLSSRAETPDHCIPVQGEGTHEQGHNNLSHEGAGQEGNGQQGHAAGPGLLDVAQLHVDPMHDFRDLGTEGWEMRPHEEEAIEAQGSMGQG